MPSAVPVTLLYASILSILYVVLSASVIRGRYKYRVAVGPGEHGAEHPFALSIRVHGNFAEYVPIALVLMALFELQGSRVSFLHGFGLLLVVARVFHAVGLSRSHLPNLGRFLGTSLTFGLLLAGGFYGLYLSRSIFQ